MNYLKELLDVLTDEELGQLPELNLRGKEAEIMQIHLLHRLDKLPGKAETIASLKISGSHFDKTVSILLRKALRLFAGDSPEKKFAYLNRKHLDLLNFHELAKREKELLGIGNARQLAEFYKLSCLMHYRAQFPHFDLDESLALADKYLRYVGTGMDGMDKLDVIDEQITLYCSVLYPYIHLALISGKEKFGRTVVSGHLDRFRELLHSRRSANAHYQFHKTASFFEWRFNQNVEESLKHLDEAMVWYESSPDSFALHDKVFLLRSKADILYGTGRNKEAFDIYSLIYRDFNDSIRTNYYHLDHFLESALLTDHPDVAKTLLDTHYTMYIEGEHETMLPFASIAVAKYELVTGNHQQALATIHRGMQFVERRVLPEQEVELRTLETAAFLLMRDWTTVDMLVSKNIKYLESKKISMKTDLRGWFFQLARAICDEQTSGKSLTEKSEEHLAQFFGGGASVYGMLFTRARASSRQAKQTSVHG